MRARATSRREEGDLERGRRLGLDVELLSGDEAHALNPFLQPDGVLAALRVGEDLYFDPRQVAIGYVRGAEARGATFLPHTTVARVDVVDAAGAWTRGTSCS